MEEKIKNFYELDAWRKGHELVIEVYKITKDLEFITLESCKDLGEKANEVRRLINGLIRSIENQK